MSMFVKVLAAAAAATLVGGVVATPASAKYTVSSNELTGVVTHKHDVKAYFKKVTTDTGPTPGVGVDRIKTQGICINGTKSLAELKAMPKHQAWSTFLMGGEANGLISIVGQYPSVETAQARFDKIMTLLAGCPASIQQNGLLVTQSYNRAARLYRGDAVTTFSTQVDSSKQEPNVLQYVMIRRVGASLSFTRLSHSYSGTTPSLTQISGAVETLSALMGYGYEDIS